MSQSKERNGILHLRYHSKLALVVLLAACGTDTYLGPDWDGVAVLGEYIIYDGAKRNYALHVPSSYDSSDATPLLIMLHGGGDTGPNFQRWTFTKPPLGIFRQTSLD